MRSKENMRIKITDFLNQCLKSVNMSPTKEYVKHKTVRLEKVKRRAARLIKDISEAEKQRRSSSPQKEKTGE